MIKINFNYTSYFKVSWSEIKGGSIIYSKNIAYFLSFLHILIDLKQVKIKVIAKPKRRKLLSLVITPQTSKRKAFQFTRIKYNNSVIITLTSTPLEVTGFLYLHRYLNKLSQIFLSILSFQNKFTLKSKVNIIYIKPVIIIGVFVGIFCYFNGYFFLGIAHNFLIFLFMFLQIVFFTTCERKILALTQRRVGPRVVGARGRLQFFADAVKLLTKSNASPKKVNMLFFQGSAVAAYWLSWLNFSNLFFSYGEDIIEIEYNIFFAIVVSLVFSIAWIVAGWSSVSKYAMLGCLRACVQSISYEILMSAILLNMVLFTGVINYEIIVAQQEAISFIFFFPYLAVIGFLATLIETNRPPFDLSEAESDLVAGYTVEYAGILFGLFYLAEYLNLFTNAIVLVILFLGSWWTVAHYAGNFLFLLRNILVLSYVDLTEDYYCEVSAAFNDHYLIRVVGVYDIAHIIEWLDNKK